MGCLSACFGGHKYARAEAVKAGEETSGGAAVATDAVGSPKAGPTDPEAAPSLHLYCSPRHRVPFNSISGGSRRVPRDVVKRARDHLTATEGTEEDAACAYVDTGAPRANSQGRRVNTVYTVTRNTMGKPSRRGSGRVCTGQCVRVYRYTMSKH
jgi:hypothetical protein